jgi:hypothetical protein
LSDPLAAWLAALDRRHLASLRFAEVRRGLQALSSLYVERRERLAQGGALDGAGKRAAFAMFYGPLHFLIAREVVRALGALRLRAPRIADLGCGTGAAGAGWALALARPAEIVFVERNAWAAGEVRFTLAQLGLRGRVVRADLGRFELPARCGGVLLAYTVNELDDAGRERWLPRLFDAASGGAAVLVLEPLARRSLGWWDAWARAFEAEGGRADEWRFRLPLPERLALLDRAAGLDHRDLLARSLFLPGAAGSRTRPLQSTGSEAPRPSGRPAPRS